MKKIAITMGDPGGVGPEIIVRALDAPEVRECCRPIVVGDRRVIREAAEVLGMKIEISAIASPEDSLPSPGVIEIIEAGEPAAFEKNFPSAEGGRACASYIKKAVDLALDKTVDAIVTAPVSKEALKMGGMKWPGHTEMLAELTATRDFAMMLAGGPLRVILVTIHTALSSVPKMITREAVLRTIRLAKGACDMLGIGAPRIGVAGLNPHAGEAGMFGSEEIAEIIPAVEEANREGIPASGPFPPDTIFHRAFFGDFDIIVCMYHDQGLIPLKMIAFDTGVNVTVGLPIIRTSPDHGTAYDIAWKGIARPTSMIEAIRLAADLRL